MKHLPPTILFVLAALRAPGDIVTYYADTDSVGTGFVRAGLAEPPVPAGPGVHRLYDNYTSPGSGGTFHWNGVYRSMDDVIADDVVQVYDVARMSAYYVPFSNMSPSGRLSMFSYFVQFRDRAGTLLGTTAFTVDLSIFPLPPNSSGVLLWPDGAFDAQDIRLPRTYFLEMRLYEPIGIAPSDLGLPYGGPVTLGYSDSGFFNRTRGEFVDLGENNTLEFLIRGVPIPSPPAVMPLALLVLFGPTRARCAKPSSARGQAFTFRFPGAGGPFQTGRAFYPHLLVNPGLTEVHLLVNPSRTSGSEMEPNRTFAENTARSASAAS